MALPENELRECLAATGGFLERRRPPPKFRELVDLHVEISGSEVVIYEIRARHQNKNEKVRSHIAKIKWVATQKVWRLFWMRSDLKWHAYPRLPKAAEINSLIAEIEKDPCGCFFG
jgi:hypothetical protein